MRDYKVVRGLDELFFDQGSRLFVAFLFGVAAYLYRY